MRIRILLATVALLSFAVAIEAQGGLMNSPPPVNSASFVQGLPSGGALATVFVFGLTGTAGLLIPPLSSPLPFELGGVRVTVNGAASPILAVVIPATGSSAPGQVNFQVPLERNVTLDASGLDTGSILIVSQTGAGQVQLPITNFSFRGGFFRDANGYAIAQHAKDLSQVTVQNPAHPGETIIVYGDDFFRVWPPPPIGFPAPSPPLFQFDTSGLYTGLAGLYLQGYPDSPIPEDSYTNTPVLKVLLASLAPGFVGVEQLNILIPAGQPAGDWALFFNSGSCPDGSGKCSPEGISGPSVLLPVR
jgi:uncharacterized protein (TIGR03437 family)